MSFNILVTLTPESSIDVDDFEIYTNDSINPIETGITRNELSTGKTINVPDDTTYIRVKSNSLYCQNEIEIDVMYAPTPTPTPSPTLNPTPTPTPTIPLIEGDGNCYLLEIESEFLTNEGEDLYITYRTVGGTYISSPHTIFSDMGGFSEGKQFTVCSTVEPTFKYGDLEGDHFEPYGDWVSINCTECCNEHTDCIN